MRITFMGTADAVSSGGRGNSCYWIDDAEGALMVDFGPTALMACRRFGKAPNQLDVLCLTHLHGDHIGGIPMLLIELQFMAKRVRPLTVIGPPGTQARLQALWQATYPGFAKFPFALIIRELEPPATFEFGGRTVRTIRALHDTQAVATSIRLTSGGVSAAFSGDTGWQPSLAALADGADLLVCECSGVEAGYPLHMDVETHLAHRDAFKVGQLVLTHLSLPARQAATRLAEAQRWRVADDGLVISLS